MGVGHFFRYIGSALLLTATALLIVADVSAPTANSLAMFRVDLSRNTDAHINFGSFGWCMRGTDNLLDSNMSDDCSKSQVGYDIAEIISNYDQTNFSDVTRKTTKALTNVMVLHAVATGLFFIAFLLSLGKGVLISLLATFITVLGFLVTVVAVICDFVNFSMLKRRIRRSNSDSVGSYGPAAWCVLAAAVLALIATILVFITCCAGRREKKTRTVKTERWHDGPAPAPARRRRFWQRRSAY